MKTISMTTALVSTAVLALLAATPAAAQATRTWVSGVGDDANPCSRTAPCKTFAGAISKTAAGGEISVLDPGGFGAVTITKAMNINGEWGGEAGVLVSGTNGIIINAGANDVVNLRGLYLEGVGTGLSGIRFINGGALNVQDCVIKSFKGTDGRGIHFNPSANSPKLTVNNCDIHNNGSGSANSGGIVIQPTGTAQVRAHISNSRIINNFGAGIKVDSTASNHTDVTLSDDVIANNTGDGLVVTSTVSSSVVMVDSVQSTNNGGAGFKADGSNSGVRVGRSTATNNTQGGMISVNSGLMGTYTTNQSINNNGVADGPLTTVTLR